MGKEEQTETGGNYLWIEGHEAVAVNGGTFTVLR